MKITTEAMIATTVNWLVWVFFLPWLTQVTTEGLFSYPLPYWPTVALFVVAGEVLSRIKK